MGSPSSALAITGVGAAALAAAFLAACGEEDAAATTPTATPEATTRQVDHYFRTTEIPAAPQRVIVTDNNALPYVLELGVVPIAAGTLEGSFDGGDFHPSLYPLGVAEATPFARDTPDFELIASLNPDLIVGASFPLENRIDGFET